MQCIAHFFALISKSNECACLEGLKVKFEDEVITSLRITPDVFQLQK